VSDEGLKDFFKKKKEKIQHGFANMLEIPEDILLNLPRITIVGNIQVYIENHRGVIEYTSEKLRVAVSNGEVEISGEDLFLLNILPDDLSLQGRIKSLAFND